MVWEASGRWTWGGRGENMYRYTVKIDSSGTVGGLAVTTKEELTATRLGDCP